MKILLATILIALSLPAAAYDCGDPVIGPGVPPECSAPEISGMWERREDQNTLVCQYTDGGWLRLNNISLQIPQNNLSQEQRCELLRCVFNTAEWCAQ